MFSEDLEEIAEWARPRPVRSWRNTGLTLVRGGLVICGVVLLLCGIPGLVLRALARTMPGIWSLRIFAGGVGRLIVRAVDAANSYLNAAERSLDRRLEYVSADPEAWRQVSAHLHASQPQVKKISRESEWRD